MRKLVDKLNSSYKDDNGNLVTTVVFIEKERFSLEDRIALWCIGSVLMLTPFREGMCLHACEFLVAQDECTKVPGPWTVTASGGTKTPTLILSEFSAISRVLRGSFRVNPWRIDEVVNIVNDALTISKEERIARHEVDLKFACEHTFEGWSERMLTDLKRARNFFTVSPAGFGFGHGYRSIGFRPDFMHLHNESLMKAYSQCSQRLILLDFGGTIVPDVNDDKIACSPATNSIHAGKLKAFTGTSKADPVMPSADVISALQILCKDPCNYVFIVSGRESYELEQAFSDVPDIGLTAEHGYFYSWPKKKKRVRRVMAKKKIQQKQSSSPSIGDEDNDKNFTRSPKGRALKSSIETSTFEPGPNDKDKAKVKPSGLALALGSRPEKKKRDTRKWELLGDFFDDSWMELTQKIVDVYTKRTCGTYIEKKGSTILWQYKDADPEFGQMQASELQDHLEGVLKDFNIEVFAGKGYVEVRPQGCGKDKACQHILEKYWPSTDQLPDQRASTSNNPDFILCIGDDVADEKMFEFLQEQYSTPKAESDDTKPIKPKPRNGSPQLFSVVVGQKPSSAQYYIDDEADVEALLGLLARVSSKVKVSRSFADVTLLSASDNSPTKENTEVGSKKRRGRRNSEEDDDSQIDLREMANQLLGCSASVPVLTDYFKSKENKNLATESTLQEFLEHIAEDDDGIYF